MLCYKGNLAKRGLEEEKENDGFSSEDKAKNLQKQRRTVTAEL